MQLSIHGWEVFFNIAYTAMLAVVAFFIFLFYKAKQPVYYGYLFWGFFLILCACFFLGLHGESLDGFIATKTKSPDEALVKENLITNLKKARHCGT